MEDGSLQLSYTSAPYSVEQVRLGKLRIVQHSTNTETEYKGGCSCFSWVGRKEQIIKGKSLVIHMSSFISCYYRQKVLFHQCSRNKSSLFSRTSHFLLRIGKKKLSILGDIFRWILGWWSYVTICLIFALNEFVQGFSTKFNESLTLCRVFLFLVDCDRDGLAVQHRDSKELK